MDRINPHISVDCVVLGYDYPQLKVLLVETEQIDSSNSIKHKLKLPGSLIFEREKFDISAKRILDELTGLHHIYLKQFDVFSDPDRLKPPEDLEWARKFNQIFDLSRVVTVAYFALIQLNDVNRTPQTIWYPVDNLPELIFDHNKIIKKALKFLSDEMRTKSLCFELLPKKFTIRQVYEIYKVVLGINFDKNNFRRKLKDLRFLVKLNEWEKNVNHKPAQLYRFDKKLYEKHKKEKNEFIL